MIPRLLGPSGLTGRYYIVTRYKEYDDGRIEAREKHDVTETITDLIAEAEERGAAKVRERVEAVLPDNAALLAVHRASDDCGCSYKDCYECGMWHNCRHGTLGISERVRAALNAEVKP